ncbi:MAG TPA: shikimate dehydrogenase [Usitatibacteraceae bacterium]
MTDRYAVIGHPVAHSKSPEIHAAFAHETRQDLSYERVLAPLDKFRQTVSAWRDSAAAGANITLPFKLEAFEFATVRTARASRGGAVNTLKFEGAEIIGDNTDGVGLCRDIVDNLGFAIVGKRVLLVGAGGAAHGVAGALLDAGPALLAITNRTLGKAEAIVEQLKLTGGGPDCEFRALELAALPAARFDLIINATSASLNANLPLVPVSCFAEGSLAYDMMYGMTATPFLKLAANSGARTADGLGMLVEQAAESFALWRGLRPSTVPVLAMLRQAQAVARPRN